MFIGRRYAVFFISLLVLSNNNSYGQDIERVPLARLRAANVARMRAERINGGLSRYRTASCMYQVGGGNCLVEQSADSFLFRFNGGPPGWEQADPPTPTVTTELKVSVDGRRVLYGYNLSGRPYGEMRAAGGKSLIRGGEKPSSAKRDLIADLWSPDWFVRRRAALGLNRLGLTADDIPDLLPNWYLKELEGGSDYQYTIIPLMIAIDPTLTDHIDSLPQLFVDGLKSRSASSRSRSVIALGAILRSASGRPSRDVHRRLVNFNPAIRLARAALQTVEKDPDPGVRRHVAIALEKQEPPKLSMPEMVDNPKYWDRLSRYSYTSCSAPRYFMSTQGDGVKELLTAMRNPETRSIAAFTLIYSLGDTVSKDNPSMSSILATQRKMAVDTLLWNLNQSPSQDLQRASLFALGELGSLKGMLQQDRIRTSLQSVLNDEREDRDIRWVAAVGLKKMGDNVGFAFNRLGRPDPDKNGKIDFMDGKIRMTLAFDAYEARYMTDPSFGCGGGLPEVYSALRNLFSAKGSPLK